MTVTSESTELVLTFGSWQRAQDFADELFDKSLAQEIEFLPVKNTEGNHVRLIVKCEPENRPAVLRSGKVLSRTNQELKPIRNLNA